ncbi:MAG: type II toxin-antitoxin system VapC family toxin [Mobilicoccus sp.]|nr:type II toxin-antitoxin system VapC family toxin [Mobilicoccus sp.]
MIVVDASCLYEVLVDSDRAEMIRARLAGESDQAAPHVLDIEVFSLIRRDRLSGHLDETAARLAVEDLRSWPGERYGHRALLARAWDLRHTVRGWDAAYVALAEVLGATLLTLDQRLANATGPTCIIEVPA